VSFQVGGGDEPMLALAALVWSLPAVGHLVLVKVAHLLESLSTHLTRAENLVTFIWALPCVNSLMRHQIALLMESLLTFFALVPRRLLLLSDRAYFLSGLKDMVIGISGQDDVFRFGKCWLNCFKARETECTLVWSTLVGGSLLVDGCSSGRHGPAIVGRGAADLARWTDKLLPCFLFDLY